MLTLDHLRQEFASILLEKAGKRGSFDAALLHVIEQLEHENAALKRENEELRKAEILLAVRTEELAAEKAKVADLTAQLAAKESAEHIPMKQADESDQAIYSAIANNYVKKESAEQEPVAIVRRNEAGQITMQTPHHDAFDMSKYIGARLYAEPITTSSAVAAALRKTAEEVKKVEGWQQETVDRILALTADDSALREICVAVAKQANYCSGRSQQELEAIVNEALGKC